MDRIPKDSLVIDLSYILIKAILLLISSKELFESKELALSKFSNWTEKPAKLP